MTPSSAEQDIPMTQTSPSNLTALVQGALGQQAAGEVFGVLDIAPQLASEVGPVSRAVFAMALNLVLFDGLLQRVPTGAAYVADVRAADAKAVFDHGALRTIRFDNGPTGELPQGEAAFLRILQPLGYHLAGVYPLDRLKMTGRAYVHADLPEAIPQFFLSELHVERFSPDFQAAAHRVFDSTVDPLGPAALDVLASYAAGRAVDLAQASAALPQIASAFGRHHDDPALADYRILLNESAEGAWIATEGCAFNHATDRVADVEALADAQRALGRPMKDKVEVSRSGRVRQTAYLADPVSRRFRSDDDHVIALSVPGSFYEFISRDRVVIDGRDQLDLTFDSGNAQGIFKMTNTA
jgi:hypothetical protein